MSKKGEERANKPKQHHKKEKKQKNPNPITEQNQKQTKHHMRNSTTLGLIQWCPGPTGSIQNHKEQMHHQKTTYSSPPKNKHPIAGSYQRGVSQKQKTNIKKTNRRQTKKKKEDTEQKKSKH